MLCVNRDLTSVTDQFERFFLAMDFLVNPNQPHTIEAAEVEVTVSMGVSSHFFRRGA